MGFRRSKKKSANQPAPNGLPNAPLPPLPGLPDLPTPGAPIPGPLPTPNPELAPMPLPDVNNPTMPQPVADTTPNQKEESDNQYNELWAKKSDKPLPQIYGHIDRISSGGDAGSLLDRYADRFGHSLDRDIIVLRKQEHDNKISQIRDAPVVELIEDEVQELSPEEKIAEIESKIRELKPQYQDAKTSQDSESLAVLKPQLESLLSERKALKAMLSASAQVPEKSEPVVAKESTEVDLFVQFVGIVDELLGSNLPQEVVDAFVASDDFSIYQSVGGDPSSADDEMRGMFFSIVDNQLGNMSTESIEAFVASKDFQIYSKIGEMYQ